MAQPATKHFNFQKHNIFALGANRHTPDLCHSHNVEVNRTEIVTLPRRFPGARESLIPEEFLLFRDQTLGATLFFIGWQLFKNWTIPMDDNSKQINLAQDYFANISRKYQHFGNSSSSEDEDKTEVSFSWTYFVTSRVFTVFGHWTLLHVGSE